MEQKEQLSEEVEQRIRECREKQDVKLDLSHMGLTYVPDAVFTLTHLERLNLSQKNTKKVRINTTKLQYWSLLGEAQVSLRIK